MAAVNCTAKLAALALAVALAACESGDGARGIERRREVSSTAPLRLHVPSATRFGIDMRSFTPPRPPNGQAASVPWRWDVPPGWVEGTTTAMRLAAFTCGEQTECTLVVLGGDGGGMRANFERWRSQMGQGPLEDDDLAALERIEVLGGDGWMIEIDGSYTGMGGESILDARMLGMIRHLPDATLFVKMTGLSSTVLAEREAFEEFCRSLERAR